MAYARPSEPHLINAINVTPFIDVMLVLLVVIIMSLPLATHKLPVDLPNGTAPPTLIEKPHMLAIDKKGALYLDGRTITDAALPQALAAIGEREAVLQMNTDPDAQYARFDAVLAVVKRAGITKLGFVGHKALTD